jgi:DNA-binding response OmpR family regulator
MWWSEGGIVHVRKILIADDDPPLRGLLRLVAARAGFDVDTASNGAEALEKIRANHYTVAVIDLMMPWMSGYDVIEHLAEMPERPAVVVVTALNDARLARLDSSVVSSILRKPFDIEMLSAVLTELAESAKAKEQNGDVIEFPSGC